jgi:hypothetical protein
VQFKCPSCAVTTLADVTGKDVSLHIRSGVRVFRGGIAPGQPNFCDAAYNICGCSVWNLLCHPFDSEIIKVTSRFIIIIYF